jgi:hypothetical protein
LTYCITTDCQVSSWFKSRLGKKSSVVGCRGEGGGGETHRPVVRADRKDYCCSLCARFGRIEIVSCAMIGG